MVLVNAVYLKADWAAPFEKERTNDGAFHAPAGDVTTPFMHNDLNIGFVTGDGWVAVELPYEGEKLAMTIVLPDAGRFDDVAGLLDRAFLDRVATAPRAHVQLALPKFDIAKSLSLRPELAALGMPIAFTDAADFSGMTKDEALAISDVVHQANVTVDEKGTVAAAATGVVMRTTSAVQADHIVRVDRPFLFLLRDVPTGAVLFAGQVTNPATK